MKGEIGILLTAPGRLTAAISFGTIGINLLYILLAIFIFGLLIFVHELGHYVTARIFKVTINEFAIGMGPKILSRRSKKTGIVYSLKLFPIGGYVSMAGEDEESDDPNAFNHKKPWKRLIILLAGGGMNILIGFLVTVIFVSTTAHLGGTTVYRFGTENVQSEAYGLQIGDKILKVNGVSVHLSRDLSYEIMHEGAQPIDLTVLRGGERIVLEGVQFPTIVSEGITFGSPDFLVGEVEKNLPNVLEQSFFTATSTVKMIWDSLIDLVTGHYSLAQMSGPVGVTSVIVDSAKSGISSLLYIFIFITMNLGVFNLLPLPALDGGRIMFVLVEMIIRKKVPTKLEGTVHLIGIALMFLLIIAITFKDIAALFA